MLADEEKATYRYACLEYKSGEQSTQGFMLAFALDIESAVTVYVNGKQGLKQQKFTTSSISLSHNIVFMCTIIIHHILLCTKYIAVAVNTYRVQYNLAWYNINQFYQINFHVMTILDNSDAQLIYV